MPSLKELARLMKELEDQLVVCMRCGLCQAVCPLFAETGREADVARGKLALLDGLAQEILQNADGVQDHLTRCLLCGSCAANCPSGVKVLDIFIKARAILAGYLGLSPLKKAIFRGLLASRTGFNRILAWGAKFQGIFIKPVDDLLGSSCARFMSPLLSEPPLQAPGPHPLARQGPPADTARRGRRPQGGLFRGLSHRQALPPGGRRGAHGLGAPRRGGLSARRPGLLRHSGPVRRRHRNLPAPGAPQPGPSGDPAAPFDYLVTACATCTSTIKKLWPLMMQDAARQNRPGLPPWPTRPWTSASSWWIRWAWRPGPPPPRTADPL